MDIIPDRCWQIAAGDSNRNYADLCLRHNVVIMGPGYCGDWLNITDSIEILQRDGWSSRKITNIEKFVWIFFTNNHHSIKILLVER